MLMTIKEIEIVFKGHPPMLCGDNPTELLGINWSESHW